MTATVTLAAPGDQNRTERGVQMKRTSTEKPYLSWAICVRNACALAANGRPHLLNLLESLRARTPEAEIVIIDTVSNDLPTDEELAAKECVYERGVPKTHTIAKHFADVFEEWTGPDGAWNREMYAVDDMAAARNYSFSKTTGKWVGWADADDEIPAADEASRLAKANARFQPGAGLGHEPVDAELLKNVVPPTLEQLLQLAEKLGVKGVICPYLYRFAKNPDGTLSDCIADNDGGWQPRERFVPNDGSWTWQSPAHEFLVPKDPADFKLVAHWPTVIFVHRKIWSADDAKFSLERHYAILKKDFDEGRRTVQGCLYLQNFAIFKEPQNRGVYLRAAYDVANTAIDKSRALRSLGEDAASDGFYFDAVERFAAGMALDAKMPDLFYSAARFYQDADQPVKAAEYFGKAAVDCVVAHPFSAVSPRTQAINYRLEAASALLKASQRLVREGREADAHMLMEQAAMYSRDASKHPALSAAPVDQMEASSLHSLFENERDAARIAKNLRFLFDYLVRNDEPLKAAALRVIVPHNLEDSKIAEDIQLLGNKLRRHMTDPKAYQDFYNADDVTGAIPGDELYLKEDACHPRIRWLISQIRAWKPDATILEVGPWDGITAIPVMRALTGCRYTALEANPGAIERFQERAKKYDVASRLEIFQGLIQDEKGQLGDKKFDAVVFFEVIEHVPDPFGTVARLRDYLMPGGRLFVSTPWGAFDRGHPFNLKTRDPRGHVRAITPIELVDVLHSCCGRVLDMGGSHGHGNFGDTMWASSEKAGVGRLDAKPITFAVFGALWDWNASEVYSTGIGASEETIVYLAEQLATDEWKRVSVFGPMPKFQGLALEEVKNGVGYFAREKSRLIDPNATVIVSRAPCYGAQLDEKVGTKLDKLLWLQDAWYPDLNEKTAADYRKIICVSEWHKATMAANHKVPEDKMTVIPNFLLARHFAGEKPKREAHRFIYASSPDRSLITVLKLWGKILERWPDATLSIFYGWDGCKKLGGADPGWVSRYTAVRRQFNELRWQKGVFDLGRVNHEQIAQEFMKSAVWLYPTSFSETWCTNAIKARAAGCVPVCTPKAALEESAKCEQTFYVPQPKGFDVNGTGMDIEKHPEWESYSKDVLEAVAGAIETSDAERDAMSKEAIESFRLEALLPRWMELLK